MFNDMSRIVGGSVCGTPKLWSLGGHINQHKAYANDEGLKLGLEPNLWASGANLVCGPIVVVRVCDKPFTPEKGAKIVAGLLKALAGGEDEDDA